MINQLVVDAQAKTITSTNSESDSFYGLISGTNGTAAQCRRLLVEQQFRATGFQWVRSGGRCASGLTLVPTDHSNTYVNQWGS